MTLIKTVLLACFLMLNLAHAEETANLEKSFIAPPDATKPRYYWYWMDGNITTNGITKDLEAMRRIGIGEAYIGIIADQCHLAPGEIKVLSEPFWETLTHAIREGRRLGMDIGVFNSPGWSQSVGSWVKPEQAMRHLVLPEIRLHGQQHFLGKFSMPEGAFEDAAVLAFPAPKDDADSTASIGGKVSKESGRVTIELPQSFTSRSLTVTPARQVDVTAELQASDDGKRFRPIRKLTIDRHNLGIEVGPVPLAPVVVAFPTTTAKMFRLQLSAPDDIGDVQLSGAARVDDVSEKSLAKVFQASQTPFNFYTWPQQAEPDSLDRIIAPESVHDLSKNFRPDCSLDWDVPPGDWIVRRIGMVPTGTKNCPAPPEATGLEVDKVNRTALKSHFDAYIGQLLTRLPAAERTAWKHVVADSYERGPQNWTDVWWNHPGFRNNLITIFANNCYRVSAAIFAKQTTSASMISGVSAQYLWAILSN